MGSLKNNNPLWGCPKCNTPVQRRDGEYHCTGCKTAWSTEAELAADVGNMIYRMDCDLHAAEDEVHRLRKQVADMQDAVRPIVRYVPSTDGQASYIL